MGHFFWQSYYQLSGLDAVPARSAASEVRLILLRKIPPVLPRHCFIDRIQVLLLLLIADISDSADYICQLSVLYKCHIFYKRHPLFLSALYSLVPPREAKYTEYEPQGLCDGCISLSVGEAFMAIHFHCSFPLSPLSGVSVAPLYPQLCAPHMLLRPSAPWQ